MNYREAYYSLFNLIKDIIEVLEEAQKEAERIIIETKQEYNKNI